jgi:Lrp/AsnC family transcriptional regulator for asnA, asnC and gidA
MNGERLDALDRQIIDHLSRDARVSNRHIAGTLGVTEGTIRTRIKRMQSEGLIHFAVVTGFRMAGAPNLVMMGIHADPRRVAGLAQELSAMPEINCVIVLLGRYSLLAMGLFSSVQQVHELAAARIRALEGVREVEITFSVHNVKYKANIARITERPVAEAGAPAG